MKEKQDTLDPANALRSLIRVVGVLPVQPLEYHQIIHPISKLPWGKKFASEKDAKEYRNQVADRVLHGGDKPGEPNATPSGQAAADLWRNAEVKEYEGGAE